LDQPKKFTPQRSSDKEMAPLRKASACGRQQEEKSYLPVHATDFSTRSPETVVPHIIIPNPSTDLSRQQSARNHSNHNPIFAPLKMLAMEPYSQGHVRWQSSKQHWDCTNSQ